jgi:antirestriction factor ArdC-like protein
MSKYRCRESDAERDERRERDRERLKQAAGQLLTSEGWKRWVRARARNGLARYSVSNLCLILLAQPDASFVAGFKAWLELGYCVRKGERAIRIFAPMSLKERDAISGEETGDTRVLFRVVSVFDRSQVAPIEGADPAPLQPPCEPLTGDTHAHLLAPACDFARSLGYAISFEATPAGVGGWCDRTAKQIVVDTGKAPNAQLRTLIHETTHALGIDYERYTREQAEVIVDSVTFIVCSGLGLAVGGETIPYVAGWGEAGALEAVNQFAHTIHELSRRIEEALQPPTTPAAIT